VNKLKLFIIILLSWVFTIGGCSRTLPEVTPPMIKSFVACFVNGTQVFSGEIIGPTKIVNLSVVTFYSIELDADVRIVNGGCIEVYKKWKSPSKPTSSENDGFI